MATCVDSVRAMLEADTIENCPSGLGRWVRKKELGITSTVRLTVLWCWAVGSEPHYLVVSHTTSPVTDIVFLYPASTGTMEGFSSVNGRASCLLPPLRAGEQAERCRES